MPSDDAEPTSTEPLRARLVLLAGPSGSGKSHLAAKLGLPTVCLDDFYKDGGDPTLPISGSGIADWDDPAAWDADLAIAALTEICASGGTQLPVYDIGRDLRTGTRHFRLADTERLVVAEGIFAADLIAEIGRRGLLAGALCLVHRPSVTFWRRLVRDLREGRKGSLTLLRRGLTLRRQEPRIVARQVALGADPVDGRAAVARLRSLRAGAPIGDDAHDTRRDAAAA